MTIDMPAAIQQFVDATNAADSDSFVAAFTDDATLYDWGRSFRGHQGVRAWDSTDNIGVQAHFELLRIAADARPDHYIATIRVSGNGYNGTGDMRFRLRDGLIADLRIG
ncbi:nuclear transport factor 2 family protein [Nocardioides sp. CER19]|uniref:nuclear transport factor 2 family protein n=1 Tax=Nocardioides sp. CER19 TaxID=3038538 RepID=UPI002446FB08|nr:nuclear transport factor 2 family protein [Nocardioides sp. CER19]MDH2415258.1 nuclear transport factor 2 family protein [Nocardioides sp. CER19]